MKQIRIGIFGSCVSREIFNYDVKKLFKIGQYFNFSSIFSQMSPIKMIKIKENELGHENQWYSKMIAADINKDALKQIEIDVPEYVVLDLMSERLMLGELMDELGNKTLITLHDDLKKCNLITGGKYYIKSEIIDPYTFSYDYIEDIVRNFSEQLLMICPVNRIIFCESFYVNQFITVKGEIECFEPLLQKRAMRVNAWLEKLERLLLYYLKGCNIIHFPSNTMADELHHLHLSPNHYCKNYYRYAYENIKTIVGGRKFSTMDMMRIDNEEMCRLMQRKGN